MLLMLMEDLEPYLFGIFDVDYTCEGRLARCVYEVKKVIISQHFLNSLETRLFEVRFIALIAATDMSDRDTLILGLGLLRELFTQRESRGV